MDAAAASLIFFLLLLPAPTPNGHNNLILLLVPSPCAALVCTLVYQAFVPVSFACAVALPLYYSWVVWDAWWLSPVFVGSLVMAPLKFAPWGWTQFCWVWPGVL